MKEYYEMKNPYSFVFVTMGYCSFPSSKSPSFNFVFGFFCQHQQQVVQAMERAKQVTMGELNAAIGVRGLPPLPPTVCISIFLILMILFS